MLLQNLVYLDRETPILFGNHITGIMRAQFYSDVIENVEPGRVVIHSFCNECHTCQEREGFLEILETEFADKLIINFLPHKFGLMEQWRQHCRCEPAQM